MKKNRLLVLSLSVFIVGFIALYLSISTMKVSAVSSLNETWTVNRYRNLVIEYRDMRVDPTWNSKSISIGPSEWQISGNIDGTTYTETYTAGGWKEAMSGTVNDSFNIGGLLASGTMCKFSNVRPNLTSGNPAECHQFFADGSYQGESADPRSSHASYLLKISGLYGFSASGFTGVRPTGEWNNDNIIGIIGSGGSYPTSWTVSGTIQN